MQRFMLEQSDRECYTSHSGLALIGLCVNTMINLGKTLKHTLSLRHGISHGDIIKAYLGLLCLGKSDVDAIEHYRHDQYFKASLGMDQVPSASRLRQRLDADADTLLPVMYEQSIDCLVQAKVPVSRLSTGHVALDIDVLPRDNSKTHTEGVSRTYKSYDGYAPIAAYLGQEGWC